MSYINAIERPYVQSRKYGNPLDVICEIVITHKFDVPIQDTTCHISASKSFLLNEFKRYVRDVITSFPKFYFSIQKSYLLRRLIDFWPSVSELS